MSEDFDDSDGPQSAVKEEVIGVDDADFSEEEEDFKERNMSVLDGRNLSSDLQALKNENVSYLNYQNVLQKYNSILTGLSVNIRTRFDDIKAVRSEIEKKLKNPVLSNPNLDLTQEIYYGLYKEREKSVTCYQDIIAYLSYSLDFMRERERKLLEILSSLKDVSEQKIISKTMAEQSQEMMRMQQENFKMLMEQQAKMQLQEQQARLELEKERAKFEESRAMGRYLDSVRGGNPGSSGEDIRRITTPSQEYVNQNKSPQTQTPAPTPVKTVPPMDVEIGRPEKQADSPIDQEVLNALSKKGDIKAHWITTIRLIDNGEAKNKKDLEKAGVTYVGSIVKALKNKGILDESWGEFGSEK